MKKHLTLYIAILLALITLTSAKPIKTKPAEAIIIGRLLIDSKIPLDTEKISIRFINGTKGGKTAKVDANGFFCIKIGIHASFIDYIEYKNLGTYKKIFTEDCATFSLPKGETIYYVGDVQLQWTPSERDKIKRAFSLGIAMGGPHMGGGVAVPIQSGYAPGNDCPPLEIMEYTDVVNWYNEKYSDEKREIVTELINTISY